MRKVVSARHQPRRYIARPNGAVDFLFMPKDYFDGPFFATIDTAIMGRKTYDVALKMGGGGFSDSKMKKLRLLPFPTARRTRRRDLRQRIAEKSLKNLRSAGKNHLVAGRGDSPATSSKTTY